MDRVVHVATQREVGRQLHTQHLMLGLGLGVGLGSTAAHRTTGKLVRGRGKGGCSHGFAKGCGKCVWAGGAEGCAEGGVVSGVVRGVVRGGG